MNFVQLFHLSYIFLYKQFSLFVLSRVFILPNKPQSEHYSQFSLDVDYKFKKLQCKVSFTVGQCIQTNYFNNMKTVFV